MPKYVIEREIPGCGDWPPEQLAAVARTSCGVLSAMGPGIQWRESYVTGETIYCVSIAPDDRGGARARAHGRVAGEPGRRSAGDHRPDHRRGVTRGRGRYGSTPRREGRARVSRIINGPAPFTACTRASSSWRGPVRNGIWYSRERDAQPRGAGRWQSSQAGGTAMHATASGHALSDAAWLDLHFERSRVDLRGDGPRGRAASRAGASSTRAADPAPSPADPRRARRPHRRADRARLRRRERGHRRAPGRGRAARLPGRPPAGVDHRAPLPGPVLDAVWCANVSQYLTDAESGGARGVPPRGAPRRASGVQGVGRALRHLLADGPGGAPSPLQRRPPRSARSPREPPGDRDTSRAASPRRSARPPHG